MARAASIWLLLNVALAACIDVPPIASQPEILPPRRVSRPTQHNDHAKPDIGAPLDKILRQLQELRDSVPGSD